MAFVPTIDGDFSSPVLLSRKPRRSNLEHYDHYFWVEVWIQNKTSYHPLPTYEQGTLHPDSLEQPINIFASSGSQIFSLAQSGTGSGPLYLISEEQIDYKGPLVVFQRTWSSLPQSWSTKEFGYHTFPGLRRTRSKIIYDIYGNPAKDERGNTLRTDPVLVTISNPANLPCLIESKHSYQIGPPESLSQFPVPTYLVAGLSTWNGVNVVEYSGTAPDPDGDGFETVYQRGDGTITKPVIETRVSRWQGPIHEVIVRTVISSLV